MHQSCLRCISHVKILIVIRVQAAVEKFADMVRKEEEEASSVEHKRQLELKAAAHAAHLSNLKNSGTLHERTGQLVWSDDTLRDT